MIDLSAPSANMEHSYKIAPVGRRVRVRIEGDAVTVSDAVSGRPLKSLSLHGIEGGRWSETQMRYAGVPSIVSRALILKGPNGSLTLRQGDGRPEAEKGPNSREFLAACADVIRAAALLNPGLRLGIGPALYVRALIAVVGAFAALIGLFGLAGGILALLTGEWLESLIFFAVALGSGASGLLTALSFNPFKQQDFIGAMDLAADLESQAKAPSS